MRVRRGVPGDPRRQPATLAQRIAKLHLWMRWEIRDDALATEDSDERASTSARLALCATKFGSLWHSVSTWMMMPIGIFSTSRR